MAGLTQPVGTKPTRPASEQAVREWLTALSDGECTQAEFLHAMRRRLAADRDGTWEVLSLLDQYYRRGKIKPDVFQAMKTSLAGSAMGAGELARVSKSPTTSAVVTMPAGDSPPASIPVLEPAADTRNAKVGDVLRGRYRIIAVLGHGGMGTVFEAIDEQRLDLATSDRRIAVKVLHTAVTHRPALLEELRREFQNLQVLSHPSIVRVYEFDRDGSIAFFTMEIIRGVLLSQALISRNNRPLPRAQALAIIRDVGAALVHAHSRGVVHGDVNPQNIFLTHNRDVRVMDFGASYRLVGGPSNADSELGFVPFATPGYASCQLQEGEAPDVRDDVFALACVAYGLLSGKHPLGDHSALDAREMGLRPRRPANLTGPQWRALKAGLRWKRETRPADVAKWLEKFELSGAAKRLDPLPSLLEAPRFRKRNYLLAAALLIVFVLVAGIGYWAATDFDSLAGQVGTLPPPTSTPAADIPQPQPPVDLQPPVLPPVQRTMPVATKPISAGVPPDSAAAINSGGSARVELLADTVDVPADEGVAHISLRRRGNLRKEAAFSWWTESGTAKPGTDYANVPIHVVQLAAGQTSLTLNVSLSHTLRAQPKSFYVVIDKTDDDTSLGPKTLTMVTLLANE